MTKFAIIIACESYQYPDIAPRALAAADAMSLGEVLEQHGFVAEDQVVLVNEQATRSIVESRLRRRLRAATADDSIYCFYAGHGFSDGQENFLTCHDTQLDDLAETSVSLGWLLPEIGGSRCKKFAMFLDADASSLLANGMLSSISPPFADNALKVFFEASASRVCLSACAAGEVAWTSGKLNHGIWAYHLLEALRGDAPGALTSDNLLTASTLQDHLTISVLRSLRAAYVDEKIQNPQIFGLQAADIILADMKEIFDRRNTDEETANRLVRVSFLGEKSQPFRSLSGFTKGRHRVPDNADDAAIAFAGRIAQDELNNDLDVTHTALKSAFRFKRADLEVGDPTGGYGTIITPYFTYNVNVVVNPADSTEVIWQREVTDIKQAEQIFSEQFLTVFDSLFNTIAFSPPTAIDLVALIDRVEDLEDERLTVNYDRDATWCTLQIAGQLGEIHVTRDTFKIVKPRAESPRALAESFFEVQRALVECHEVRLIPFGEP